MKPIVREFAVLAGLAAAIALAGALAGRWPAPPAGAPAVDDAYLLPPAEAVALDPLWLDARERRAYEAGHISGAIHFDEGDPDGSVFALLEAWAPPRVIVVYCADPACGTSSRLARQLRDDLGFDAVYALEGGWETWIRERDES